MKDFHTKALAIHLAYKLIPRSNKIIDVWDRDHPHKIKSSFYALGDKVTKVESNELNNRGEIIPKEPKKYIIVNITVMETGLIYYWTLPYFHSKFIKHSVGYEEFEESYKKMKGEFDEYRLRKEPSWDGQEDVYPHDYTMEEHTLTVKNFN